jgi:hypothetical protein
VDQQAGAPTQGGVRTGTKEREKIFRQDYRPLDTATAEPRKNVSEDAFVYFGRKKTKPFSHRMKADRETIKHVSLGSARGGVSCAAAGVGASSDGTLRGKPKVASTSAIVAVIIRGRARGATHE